MSNSSLKINQLNLAGEGTWPDLHIEKLSPTLNVFYGAPRSGKSSVAQLVGHLLYGKSESAWRQQFAETVPSAEGSLHLTGFQGEFVLRRHRDANRQSRLTISSANGDTTDGKIIQSLLSGLSPQQAAQLFVVDFSEAPRVDWLLSETFTREFSSTQPTKTAETWTHQNTCCNATNGSTVDRVDRQRIDELVSRRDSIAGEIEQQMSMRRRESETLERELREVDTSLASKRKRAESLQAQLHGLQADLAELETRLRYYSLDHYSKHSNQSINAQNINLDAHQQELTELDREITRCRQSLSEVQQRENSLRTELAQSGSDGTADSVTCLADGRATLGVLEQLLDDLDAEVSQLARASEPGRCVGHETHAKLSPVASLLRQQVYTLCGQLTEQERIVRRQQLTTESRQLARVLVELGERLDLLLSRRESLIQRSQLAGQPARLVPQPPVAEHCHCEHHGNFVQQSEGLLLGRADRGRHEAEARSQLSLLQRERTQLLNELNALQSDILQLETRWEDLQRERAGLIGGASLETKQTELERLESVIRQSLHSTEPHRAEPHRSSTGPNYWRASDLLAQLTNGQFVQIRLQHHEQRGHEQQRHEPRATLIDHHGQPHTIESLSEAQCDQLYLALTLSLISAYARRNIYLPLILDEPFLRQNDVQTAIMVGVLDEFARAGHQLLTFTEDREARRRFAINNAALFDLEQLRKTSYVAPSAPITTESTPTVQITNTRIIRETYDGHSTPVLKLASVEGDSKQDDLFYLTEASSINDFPVLGADTSAVFSRINIHSILDLLVADAAEVARQLGCANIETETVRLWQIHMGLMSHIPNLTLDDAQVLAAGGIHSPEDLFDADIEALLQSIEAFLSSDQGRRFAQARQRYSRSRLSGLRSSARRYRDRWQRARSRYSSWSSSRSSRRSSQRRSSTSRKTNNGSQREPRQRKNRQRNGNRQWKFYLSREQDVEAAPSIGPKTAVRLSKVGIRTVADLLNADPESTATELDTKHIKADTIADWQHQARLVCQIPQLRGYGAQLLVACGLTQPEQIASTSADELVSQVLSFCNTKEGQRILRSGDAPEREKIAEWVEFAANSRPLEAA